MKHVNASRSKFLKIFSIDLAIIIKLQNAICKLRTVVTVIKKYLILLLLYDLYLVTAKVNKI